MAIQHYVIKFVGDLRQVDGFLWVLWFHPPINMTEIYINEILLKVVFNGQGLQINGTLLKSNIEIIIDITLK
jgi:hypothetical protein